MRFFLFVAMLVMMSCSPQKRFSRLIDRHPELISSIDTEVRILDTFNFRDTLYTSGIKDTFFIKGDTTIERAKYTFTRKGDFNLLDIKPDTFYINDTAIVEKILKVPGKIIIQYPEWLQWIQKNFLALIIALILTLILALINRRKAVENRASSRN